MNEEFDNRKLEAQRRLAPSSLLGMGWIVTLWVFLIAGGMMVPGILAALMLLHHPRAFEWILIAAMCWIIFDVGKVVTKYPPWKL